MSRAYDFIANTSDGVFGLDCRQTIVLWNAAATSMLGYSLEEVLGKSCFDIVQGRDAGGCVVCRRDCHVILAAEHLELPQTQNLLARKQSGDEIWINLSMIVIPSAARELSVLIHLFREVSVAHEAIHFVREIDRLVGALSGPLRGQVPAPSPTRQALEKLTGREREILKLLVEGASTEAVADQLCISPHTVRRHVSNLLAKLGVHTRLEAVAHSVRNGLV